MRYLDLLEDQLVTATRELSGSAAVPRKSTRVSRFRTLFRRHTALMTAAGVVALVGT